MPSTLPGVSWTGRKLNICGSGYLWPIRNVEGLLVGCQLRLRKACKDRYRWLSSSIASAQLLNGELPLAVYRPAHIQRQAIALVEGTGPKPRILCLRQNQLTVGAASGHASSPQTLKHTLQVLASEQKTKEVEFYPDAGAVTNHHVLRQYRATWRLLHQWGYSIRVAWWGQVTKAVGDIDEVDTNCALEWLTTAQFEALAQEYQPTRKKLEDLKLLFAEATHRHSKPSGFQPAKAQILPSAATMTYAPETLLPEPGEGLPPTLRFQPGQRLAVIQALTQKGWKHILDRSQPGLGKSYDAGLASPETFVCNRLWYFSDSHRNPTTKTIEDNYTDMPVRNDGMVVDQRRKTPLGQPHTRWPQKHELPDTPGNCFRTPVFAKLRAKNIACEGTENPVCGTCHLKAACSHTSGPGYGHRHERHQAFRSERIRLHPNSAPDPESTSFDQDGAFWDEAMKVIQPIHAIPVKLADFDQAMAALEAKQPAVHAALKPLRTSLRALLSGEQRQPRHGWNDAALRGLLPTLPEHLDCLIAELASTVPDLTACLEAPDGLSLENVAPRDKATWKRAHETLRQTSYQESLTHLDAVPLQWLIPFLQVWGQCQPGALRLEHGLLTITVRDFRHRQLAQALAWNVYQDATAKPEYLALYLNIAPSAIVVIEQEAPRAENLEVIQLIGLGKAGRKRSDSCQRRVAALKAELISRHPDLAFIDFKALAQAPEGWWFNHNRGSNDFEARSALASFGIPYPNIGVALSLYQTLVERLINEEDAGFQAFTKWLTDAEIIQTPGRLRAHNRSHQQLTYYFCADYILPEALKPRLISAQAITVDAGTAAEQALHKVGQAISQMVTAGEKLTQRGIAQATGLSQGRISQIFSQLGGWKQCKKILVSLLKPSSGATNNFTPSDEETRWLATVFLPALAHDPPEAVLDGIQDLIAIYGDHGWQQLMSLTDFQTQTALLAACLQLLPTSWQVELAQLCNST